MLRPKNTGSAALRRLHQMKPRELERVLGLYTRWYWHLSERTGSLTGDLLKARRRRKELEQLAKTNLFGEAHAAELEEVSASELDADAEQRGVERMRETYEKSIAAVLRIIDLRRAEISARR